MIENFQLSEDFTYGEYAGAAQSFGPAPIPGGVAITTINGLVGPRVNFDGGTSGFTFTPAGSTLSLLSPLSTKGDLYTRTTSLGSRLAVGADGQTLSADSTQLTGLKWITPTAGTVTATGTLTANQLIIGNGGTDEKVLGTLGTTTTVLHGNAAGAPTFAAVSLTADVTGTLPVANGGTAVASYAVGDLIYASGSTTLSKLADVATGNALISGGVTTAPAWGKIGLTTHVSGTLPVGNGGTGTGTAFTAGSVVFAGTSGVYSQNNSKLFWDDTNTRLGIGTPTPGYSIEAVASSADTSPFGSYVPGGATLFRNSNNTNNNYTAIGFANSAASGFLVAAIVAVNETQTTTPTGHLSFATKTAGTFAERMRIDGTGLGLGMAATKQLELSTDSAQKPTTNTWTITSDRRVKKDIIPYKQGLEAILKINPVQYHYNGKGQQLEQSLDDPFNVGIIAQELQKDLPELVSSSKGRIDGKETRVLAYEGHNLAFMLVNAVKELKRETEKLKAAQSKRTA